MLDRLIELKKSIEQNWVYLYKVLFTLSFYLLYKAFLKVLSPESMSPYIIIFIIIGFVIFTIDILIYPITDLFVKNKSNKKLNIANMLVYLSLLITILSTVLYYVTGQYPFDIVVIYSLMMAVLSYSFFIDYKNDGKNKIIKSSIIVLSIIGLAGVIHSFYLNKALNVNTFTLIFVIGFFILDYLIYKWRVK